MTIVQTWRNHEKRLSDTLKVSDSFFLTQNKYVIINKFF